MRSKRITMVACAIVTFAMGGNRLLADDNNANKNQKWLDPIATKLGLNDQQKEAILKSHERCERDACPIEHQIWAQCHAEIEAIKQQLNEQQQAAFKEAIHATRQKELDAMATRLSLNADQKKQLQTICNDFEAKFQTVAANGEKSDKVHQQYRDLRHDFIAAVRPILNPEQQSKLPFVIEEEHQRWRDPAVRRTHLKEVLAKLDLTQEKRQQITQINQNYEKQIEPLFTELTHIRKVECDQMESQLTAEQREKFQQMRKSYSDQQ